MSIYYLARKVTAAQTGTQQVGSQVVKPSGPNNANMPPLRQSFVLTVEGNGECDATAQVYGSNDVGAYERGEPMNWIAVGAAMNASGTAPSLASAVSDIPFQFYTAVITAISGTNASAKVEMGA